MRHDMKLQHAPFRAIAEGRKTMELRLYDEKRRAITVGDEIRFTDTENGDTILTLVTALYRYPDFSALYTAHDKCVLGYSPQETADPSDMSHFYRPEDIRTYGVLGIALSLIHNDKKGILT